MKLIICLFSLLVLTTARVPLRQHTLLRGNAVHPVHASSKIVGGEIVTPHSVPYQVGLLIFYGLFFCGGSVLSETWVLTAAHCGEMDNTPTAVFGAHEIGNVNEAEQVRLVAVRSVVHESWDSATLANDIALIELSSKIKFTSAIQPIALPWSLENESFADQDATVTGWGLAHDYAVVQSRYLRTVTSKLLSNQKCSVDLAEVLGDVPLLSSHICLDGTDGKSACNGDSGGPLVVNNNGALVEVGIVSFGSSSGCEKGFPSAYTRTTSFLSWIRNNTGITSQ